MEALAITTDKKWQEKLISPGERALLCDMMVASVCSADLGFQQLVNALSTFACPFSMSWVFQGCKALLLSKKNQTHFNIFYVYLVQPDVAGVQA